MNAGSSGASGCAGAGFAPWASVQIGQCGPPVKSNTVPLGPCKNIEHLGTDLRL